MKKIISTTEVPAAIGPYSQAVRVGPLVFTSGQIPLDPQNGNMDEGHIPTQTRRVLDNMTALLKAENLTMSDIVKTTIFLTDMNDFAKVNEVYGSYFKDQPPARSTVAVAGLPKGSQVEIECIALAARGDGGKSVDTWE